jgi:hypothetical protein
MEAVMGRELKATLLVDGDSLFDMIHAQNCLEHLSRDPMLGGIVIYVLPDGPRKGEPRAAIISRVWQPAGHETAPGMSNLCVIRDQADDFPVGLEGAYVGVGSVLYDPSGKPGTWHWFFDELDQSAPPLPLPLPPAEEPIVPAAIPTESAGPESSS